MRHLVVTRRDSSACPGALVLSALMSLLLLVLNACGPVEDCVTKVAVQAPGVTPVLTANFYPGRIGSILPYLDASGSRHALLLGLGVNVRLSSSELASTVSDDVVCGSMAGWSADHSYLACSGRVAALRFAPDGTVTAAWTGAEATLGAPPYSPTYASADWWPNSRVLTLVRSVNYQTSDGCSIDFYVLDRTASQLQLTGRLFPQEATSPCTVLQAVWSPDGQDLALLTATSVQVLLRSALPAAMFSFTNRPVTAYVTPRTLASGFTRATWIAWRPNMLAVTVADGTTIQQLTVPNGQRSTLLSGTRPSDSAGDGAIGPFAWWPDGHHLIFGYGVAQGAEWLALGTSTAQINAAAVLRLARLPPLTPWGMPPARCPRRSSIRPRSGRIGRTPPPVPGGSPVAGVHCSHGSLRRSKLPGAFRLPAFVGGRPGGPVGLTR